ncbi:uncharacterized protein LOC100206428 isoform X1 [Hydra vulgaris]|uniref:Uncharacterized protein LOC100206428 isoform X1 n=1 Tax=Hydra vulgaris TaxID=6087 RepID=A0ABM4D6D0_HYDVU
MNVLALLCLAFAVCVSTRDINRATLEELSKLLEQYESSVNEKSTKRMSSENFSSPFLISEQKSKCATNCRNANDDCQFLSDNHLQKIGCSETFIRCYPDCFFAYSKTEDENLETCQAKCQFNFDQCILIGTKVEQFACFNSRQTCNALCSNNTVSKRGCPEDCAGQHEMCMSVVQTPSEHLLCNIHQSSCKSNCDKRS